MKIYGPDGTIRDATPEEEKELKLIQKIRAEEEANYELHKYDGVSYKDIVASLIRLRFSINDELAILRQKETKPEEWEEYYTFCEEKKNEAREIYNKFNQ